MEEKPKIRQIEAMPVNTPQGRIIVLRDPFGFSPALLQISQHAFYIVTLLDGTRDIREMQAQFLSQFGQMVYSEHIEELLAQLDSCHFLDNDNFSELKRRTISEFIKAPARPASHAGTAYPESEAPLRAELDKLFAENGAPLENVGESENSLRGLIAPHIDLERGAQAYIPGYCELAAKSTASTYVILGTAHTGMKRPYCLTLKDFETPLGMLANDREMGEELLGACPWLADDEFTHRGEHSIEFQALFLQYLFGGKRDISILPILCGTFRSESSRFTEPAKIPEVEFFIETLTKIARTRPGEVCIIAGADLAHIGTRFGDPQPVNEKQLKYVEDMDRTTLELVEKCNAEGFYKNVISDGDRRKICGLPNIYTMLRVLGKGTGRLIKYAQAPDESTGSAVTFASLIME